MKQNRFQPYAGSMDPECVRICDLLNAMPGVATLSSCSGHHKKPFAVLLVSSDPAAQKLISSMLPLRWKLQTEPTHTGYVLRRDLQEKLWGECITETGFQSRKHPPMSFFSLLGPVGFAGLDTLIKSLSA